MPWADPIVRRAKDKARHARYYKKHKKRIRERNRKWIANDRKKRPQFHRDKSLVGNRKRAGMTDPTAERKSGDCEICGLWYKSLVLDHDHGTGLKRGWLCSWCNLKLGWLEKHKVTILGYLGRT